MSTGVNESETVLRFIGPDRAEWSLRSDPVSAYRTVVETGFVYFEGTSGTPTLSNFHGRKFCSFYLKDGPSAMWYGIHTGAYGLHFNNLTPNQSYVFRPYVRSLYLDWTFPDTNYGENRIIDTSIGTPLLSNCAVLETFGTKLVLSADFNVVGRDPIIERGFCYKQYRDFPPGHKGPITQTGWADGSFFLEDAEAYLHVYEDNFVAENGYWENSGSFTLELPGLAPDTYYQVRAYAVNIEGENYSDSVFVYTKDALGIHTKHNGELKKLPEQGMFRYDSGVWKPMSIWVGHESGAKYVQSHSSKFFYTVYGGGDIFRYDSSRNIETLLKYTAPNTSVITNAYIDGQYLCVGGYIIGAPRGGDTRTFIDIVDMHTMTSIQQSISSTTTSSRFVTVRYSPEYEYVYTIYRGYTWGGDDPDQYPMHISKRSISDISISLQDEIIRDDMSRWSGIRDTSLAFGSIYTADDWFIDKINPVTLQVEASLNMQSLLDMDSNGGNFTHNSDFIYVAGVDIWDKGTDVHNLFKLNPYTLATVHSVSFPSDIPSNENIRGRIIATDDYVFIGKSGVGIEKYDANTLAFMGLLELESGTRDDQVQLGFKNDQLIYIRRVFPSTYITIIDPETFTVITEVPFAHLDISYRGYVPIAIL